MTLLALARSSTLVTGFRPSLTTLPRSFSGGVQTGMTSPDTNTDTSTDTTTDITTDTSSSSAPERSPWSPTTPPPPRNTRVNKSRFRQHVNPLARKFQMPTELSETWPNDGSFDDPTLPLHVDVGCGKGGFLLSLAAERLSHPQRGGGEGVEERRNYLGLEIRPTVASYARERLVRHEPVRGSVDFLGCNANVDLRRLLSLYTARGRVALVSVQYPDPHFKKQHKKRRVVTPEFVGVLAELLEEGAEVFLQSDVKDVLDGMREAVAEGRSGGGGAYFVDQNEGGYLEENPIGVPTEREVSVLEKGGEVYRVVFERSSVPYVEVDVSDGVDAASERT